MPTFTLDTARDNWNDAAQRGAINHILTDRPYSTDEFYATGRQVIEDTIAYWDWQKIPRPNGRALDFGCGLGRLTRALASYYDEAWGVDISTEMIDQAWYGAPRNCRFATVHRDLRSSRWSIRCWCCSTCRPRINTRT
jgi:2-polyprenyl-3-methyl-5-hydroxy-6-metoxy-1,4-benzoquinol methylase